MKKKGAISEESLLKPWIPLIVAVIVIGGFAGFAWGADGLINKIKTIIPVFGGTEFVKGDLYVRYGLFGDDFDKIAYYSNNEWVEIESGRKASFQGVELDSTRLKSSFINYFSIERRGNNIFTLNDGREIIAGRRPINFATDSNWIIYLFRPTEQIYFMYFGIDGKFYLQNPDNSISEFSQGNSYFESSTFLKSFFENILYNGACEKFLEFNGKKYSVELRDQYLFINLNKEAVGEEKYLICSLEIFNFDNPYRYIIDIQTPLKQEITRYTWDENARWTRVSGTNDIDFSEESVFVSEQSQGDFYLGLLDLANALNDRYDYLVGGERGKVIRVQYYEGNVLVAPVIVRDYLTEDSKMKDVNGFVNTIYDQYQRNLRMTNG